MQEGRSRSRRLLLAVLLLVFLAVVLEAVSFGLWWWKEGTLFSYAEARRQREALVQAHQRMQGEAEEAARERPAEAEEPPLLDPRGGYLAEEMVHPFLGFVLNPDLNLVPNRISPALAINNHGFYRFPEALGDAPRLLGAPPQVVEEDRFRVGVFGGSVAFVFSFAGADALARELAAAGVVEDAERVEVVSYALGGYKQPQQLLTLVWVLSLGERLDAVVNLDGFNEVSLSLLENAHRGVYPHYPRAWRERVVGVPDLRYRGMQGEVVFLRDLRAGVARWFGEGGSPVGRLLAATVIGNLAWRSLDRRTATAVAKAEADLGRYKTPRRRPAVARGPDFDRDDDGKVVESSVLLWTRASRQMRDLCAARGISYHHFLQPNQYVPGSKPLSAEELRSGYSEGSVFRPVVETAYPRLSAAGEALAAEGVPFHDLTGVFRQVEETVYVDDCCHLNPRGNDILAGAVARAMAADRAGAGRQ